MLTGDQADMALLCLSDALQNISWHPGWGRSFDWWCAAMLWQELLSYCDIHRAWLFAAVIATTACHVDASQYRGWLALLVTTEQANLISASCTVCASWVYSCCTAQLLCQSFMLAAAGPGVIGWLGLQHFCECCEDHPPVYMRTVCQCG